MAKPIAKKNSPPASIRWYLEPGPVILISSQYKGERDIMTCGWHMMLGEPALVGCYIWDQNYSRHLIHRSKECVINIPTQELIDEVIGIGNCSAPEGDKFERFGLTAGAATAVDAPLIRQCHANFECKLVDTRLIRRYSLFVFEVVKAHVARQPRYPKTLHFRGDGTFMFAGGNRNYRSRFLPEKL